MTSAIRGKSSEMRSPGTQVSIDPISPRTSRGASGLGSNVSCCGGEPYGKSRMHDFALPNVARGDVDGTAARASCSRSQSLRVRPNAPRPPTWSRSRRVTPSHSLFGLPRIRSTADPHTPGWPGSACPAKDGDWFAMRRFSPLSIRRWCPCASFIDRAGRNEGSRRSRGGSARDGWGRGRGHVRWSLRVDGQDLARWLLAGQTAGGITQGSEELELGSIVIGDRAEIGVVCFLQALKRDDDLLRAVDENQDISE